MQIIDLDLNSIASLHSIVRLFCDYNTDTDTTLNIKFTPPGYVPSEVYPVICSFINEVKSKGHSVICNSNMAHGCDVSNYASRIDFFKHLGVEYNEYFSRHPSDRFMEIDNAPKNCYGISHTFSDIFTKDFGMSDDEAEFVGFFIDEMIGNVTMHSKGESGAFFWCQKYPSKNGLEVVIVDSGIGISKSLSKIDPNKENSFYLEESIKFGVTNGEGRGHGLFFISEFLRRNGGSFELWSGENYLKLYGGYQFMNKCSEWKGVILKFLIKFDVKVSLQDLFIEKGCAI